MRLTISLLTRREKHQNSPTGISPCAYMRGITVNIVFGKRMEWTIWGVGSRINQHYVPEREWLLRHGNLSPWRLFMFPVRSCGLLGTPW